MSSWLAAAYAALALGLAWTLASGPSWWRRAPFIVCAPALAVALWLDRPDPAGWPSPAKTPDQANLVCATVDEPDPAASDPGHIYLWLDVGAAAPRAYSLPSSRQLQQRLQRALKAVKGRRAVEVARTADPPTHRRGGPHGSQQQSNTLRFRPGKASQLPPKPDETAASP
jgi:hypothetical protein